MNSVIKVGTLFLENCMIVCIAETAIITNVKIAITHAITYIAVGYGMF